MLYPQNNHCRTARLLDGVWQFCKDPDNMGERNEWTTDIPDVTIPMPVPAAFNEMTQDPELRDYWGKVWYFTQFDAPPVSLKRTVLRFGSVHREATVWLNGQKLGVNSMGKLPFEFDVTNLLKTDKNLLAVCVDTRLTWQTLPPGETAEGHLPKYHFDFLNFGGILRSVWLIQTSETYIADIHSTTLADGDRPVGFDVSASVDGDLEPTLRLLDSKGNCVATGRGQRCVLRPDQPAPWSPESPYLYEIEVSLGDIDCYKLKTGLRTIRVEEDGLFLNGRRTYLKGFGMHEDFHLVGHGHSEARNVKDLTMLKAMGANSFRTAHYPYAEEVYQLADQIGLMVIDETPAVGMSSWGAHPCFDGEHLNEETLETHKENIRRLFARDKNHPSVIMWCIANEAADWEDASVPYFSDLVDLTKSLDAQRPVMMVTAARPPDGRVQFQWEGCVTKCAHLVDVIGYNRYYSWYTDSNPGRLHRIPQMVKEDIEDFHKAFPGKPLMLTEFGADAIAGMHSDPPVMFSEEYQWESIALYLKEMDPFPCIIGEHLWNFADFMTKQGLTRIMGNRKGLHTRDRQPKLAATFLKKRWQSLPEDKSQWTQPTME